MPISFCRAPPVWSLCASLSAYSESRHSVPYADVGIRYDIVIVGERFSANSTLSLLLANFLVEQLPYFRR